MIPLFLASLLVFSKSAHGINADIRQFPYVVSLVDSHSSQAICTGVLVTPKLTLTACLCMAVLDELTGNVEVLDPVEAAYYVSAGSTTIHGPGESDTKKVESFQVTSGCRQYAPGIWHMNAGVAKLVEPFQLIPGKIEVVGLAPPCNQFIENKWNAFSAYGNTCDEIGFGLLNPSQPDSSNTLKLSKMAIKSNVQCAQVANNASLKVYFGIAGFACAVGDRHLDASDVGAPIICLGKYYGMIHGHLKQDESEFTVLLTRLDSYLQFLKSLGVPLDTKECYATTTTTTPAPKVVVKPRASEKEVDVSAGKIHSANLIAMWLALIFYSN